MTKNSHRLENAFIALWLRDYSNLPFHREFVVGAWQDWAAEKKARGLSQRAVPFKADFAWPDACVCLEIQGATFVKGGHSTGPGIERDAIKSLTAQAGGWAAVCLTDKMITRQSAIWLPKVADLISSRLHHQRKS